jgi:hypothetical protein
LKEQRHWPREMAYSTQTLYLKGVPLQHANAVVAAVVRKACPDARHNPHPGQDAWARQRAPSDAQKALDSIEAWVHDERPEMRGRRPRVLKTALEEVYFALYVQAPRHGAKRPGSLV